MGAFRRTCLMSPISLGILTVLWVVDEGSGSEVSKFRQREANFRAGWEIVISVGKIPISHFYHIGRTSHLRHGLVAQSPATSRFCHWVGGTRDPLSGVEARTGAGFHFSFSGRNDDGGNASESKDHDWTVDFGQLGKGLVRSSTKLKKGTDDWETCWARRKVSSGGKQMENEF